METPEDHEDDHKQFSEEEIAEQLRHFEEHLDHVEVLANSDEQWRAARAKDPLYQTTTHAQRKANQLKLMEAFLRGGKEGLHKQIEENAKRYNKGGTN